MSRHPLTELVDQIGLFEGELWNKQHFLFKAAVPVDAFMSVQDFDEAIGRPLFRQPYFSVLKEGVWADPDRVTRIERFRGNEVTRLANAAGIRQAVAEGGTVKLNQMEDWHSPSRQLVNELEALLPAEIKSYVFFTPRRTRGTRPHRDAAHVLVVQLAGTKEWRLYARPEFISAEAGLVEVDIDDCSHRFTMEAGDVLYLPHGWPHVPLSHDDDSFHLTLTVTEPEPMDLVEALLATFRQDSVGLMGQQARLQVADKAEAVLKALSSHVQDVPADRVLATALANMRRRIA